MLNNTYDQAHGPEALTQNRWCKYAYTHILHFCCLYKGIRQLCSVNWDLDIRGSSAPWHAAVLQERSYAPRPTTGYFLINKDFLLSTEVPTDAFIGAKFTLCTRRKLPLGRSEWRRSSRGTFSCLSRLCTFQNKIRLPQQGSFCTPTSRGLYLNDYLLALECWINFTGFVVSLWEHLQLVADTCLS